VHLNIPRWPPDQLPSNSNLTSPQAKPRRGKTTETKKPRKFQPAPIPQYNRTPTPEPPRDPNFVFVPGLHNPLNVGHVVIEDAPGRVETVRDGGKYPTRPGSKKRPMSSYVDLFPFSFSFIPPSRSFLSILSRVNVLVATSPSMHWILANIYPEHLATPHPTMTSRAFSSASNPPMYLVAIMPARASSTPRPSRCTRP
jgi:hypothetical protein